jgi:hypothetical protein
VINPEPNDWGFYGYGYDDGPPYCGGGEARFLWFDARPAMYAYVRDYLPWDPRYLEDPRPSNAALAQSVRGLFDDVSLVRDDVRLLEALNTVLKGEYQIEWWGTLSQLIEDTAEFPLSLRRSFWWDQDIRKEDNDTAIPEEQVYAFLEFVSSFGDD